MEDILEFPSELPLSLPAPPYLPVIGTKASIDMTMGSYCIDKLLNVKNKLIKKGMIWRYNESARLQCTQSQL